MFSYHLVFLFSVYPWLYLSLNEFAVVIWTPFVVFAEYLSAEDFPVHIKSLVQKEKESEEQEKRQREIERNTCKVCGSRDLFLMSGLH